MKKEREDWSRLYHKILKGIEAIIDAQRIVKDMKKMVEEMNTTIMEMKETILMASINNQTVNTMNIMQISKDLQYLVQSDMDKQAFQIQRIPANELDRYKERGNRYVDKNIQEIQELYVDEEMKKEKEKVEDDEVILIKPYEVSTTTSLSSQTSFIIDEVENLFKYMKFVQSPTQTRLFKPPPHYQSLKSRGEQDPLFWKEVVMAFVNQKHNTNTAKNGYQIQMFQGGPPHEPYFIAIDNWDQIIISSSKKIVAIHVKFTNGRLSFSISLFIFIFISVLFFYF